MDDTSQAAQGTEQIPAQGTPNQAAQADQEFKSGIQKRIDELTAQRYRAEETAQKYQEQLLNMTQQMAELSARQNAPPKEQLPELTEETRPLVQYLERQFKQREQQFEAQLAQMHAVLQQNQASQFAGQYASKLGVQDGASWIQERAGQVAAGFRQRTGYTLTPEDAARFATMEWLEKQAQNPQGARDSLGRFMPKGSGITNAPNPPQNFQSQSQRQARPAGFEDLSPSQQIQWLEKNGVDDIPL